MFGEGPPSLCVQTDVCTVHTDTQARGETQQRAARSSMSSCSVSKFLCGSNVLASDPSQLQLTVRLSFLELIKKQSAGAHLPKVLSGGLGEPGTPGCPPQAPSALPWAPKPPLPPPPANPTGRRASAPNCLGGSPGHQPHPPPLSPKAPTVFCPAPGWVFVQHCPILGAAGTEAWVTRRCLGPKGPPSA